ncbi:hypothetical protein Ndes2437B_g01297 [Nannochloris sp. 'desiccata']
MVCISNAWSMHTERSHFSVTQKNSEASEAPLTVTSAPGPSSSPSTPRGAVVLQCGASFQQRWYGRLGNNILSILNAALDAEIKGLDFLLKDCSHSILNLAPYDYYSRQNSRKTAIKQILTPAEAFYINIYNYPQELEGLELILPFPAACCSRKRILTPLLEKFYSDTAALKYSPDVLVMHIRSGDIFDRSRPAEHRYSPPPLAYYQKVIAEHGSRHSSSGSPSIIIVTELENMSPLVDALLRLYPPGTITLQAGTLEEDVAVVLGARHLVASQGTFAYALALASPNLETLYMFNNIVHALDERAFWCDVNKVYSYAPNAGEYIGRWELEKWTASSEQIQYLLDYPAENLTRTALESNTGYCE